MRTGTDFDTAVRRGRRAGTTRLVAHCATTGSADAARVGFVVSKAVGGSVVRHRVVRRLRESVRPHVHELEPGTLLVIRAQRPAATATSAELAGDVTRLLGRVGAVPVGRSA